MTTRILIVDDQRSARLVLRKILLSIAGVEILEADGPEVATRILDAETVHVAFVDLRLSDAPGDRRGHDVVRHALATSNAVPIVVTAFAEMVEVREAMRAGARDYVLKDELCEELVIPVVERIRDELALRDEVVSLRARESGASGDLGMVGDSPAIERLRDMLRRVAASSRPVLVTGPSGSGKELAVQAIHRLGGHPDAPLVDLNCATFPEHLVEAQLFGHQKGAFTGAERSHAGLLGATGAGTLFLDEIGELDLALQSKLLRVMETGRYRSVGSTEVAEFAGRIVAATHRDLAEEVRGGRFREDLLFRLEVLQVRVPSLEERRGDIPALVALFAEQQPRRLRLTQGAIAALQRRPWPGNVRELRNLVDRLSVFCDDDPITERSLEVLGSPGRRARGEPFRELARAVFQEPVEDKLAHARDVLVTVALELAEGNKSQAARLLGVHRKVVERLLTSGE